MAQGSSQGFRTPIGFHDAHIAAKDLFASGSAELVTDPEDRCPGSRRATAARPIGWIVRVD